MDAMKLICRRRVRRLAKYVWSVVKEHDGKEAEVMEDLRATLPWPLLIELAIVIAKILISIYLKDGDASLVVNSLSSSAQLDSEELFILADDYEEDSLRDYANALRWIAKNSHIVIQDVED